VLGLVLNAIALWNAISVGAAIQGAHFGSRLPHDLSARRYGSSFHTALAAADLDAGWWQTRVVPVLRARWAALDAGLATRRRVLRATKRRSRRDSAPGG
jgi:ABC-type transporter Mla maintaining outer membrane lipid asymmetry permease subunit MlaE